MQPISDNFLPESEQFLPNSIMTALTNQATKIQLEVLLGATDLEALNNNGRCWIWIFDYLGR